MTSDQRSITFVEIGICMRNPYVPDRVDLVTVLDKKEYWITRGSKSFAQYSSQMNATRDT
jgi:hypothetical protein